MIWEDAAPRDAVSSEAFRLLVTRAVASCCPQEPAREEPPESIWSLSLSPEDSAEDLLAAVIDRLPQTQRLLFLFHHAAGLTVREAADAAGGETSAAEGLLRRADQSVKRQLSLLKFKVGLSNAPTAREIDGLLRTMTAETLVPDELDAEGSASASDEESGTEDNASASDEESDAA